MPGEAFVIMQIGNPEMDAVYETAIAPAARGAGLDPQRIDQDNEGGLLKAEIMALIEASDIIIADLTNERPNCYLEVGYAMGLGRNSNLILTVRQDHLPDHADHVPGGPKVHFDLAGYDLLLWDPSELPHFMQDLERRVLRRLAISTPATAPLEAGTAPGDEWTDQLRQRGLTEIQRRGGTGFMEIAFGIEPSKLLFTQRDLLDAARQSTVDTFGWPIGVLLNREDARPRPTGSGVHAEVAFELGSTEQSFDLWELRTNGDFYTILSLFEDQRQHGEELFFDTRIVRVAEAFLYCGRLYTNLGVPRDAQIHMTIKHGGLEGRTLTASSPGRRLSMGYTSDVDISEVSLGFALGEIDAALTDLVRRVTGPLFELFDFFRLGAEVHDDIVDRFVRGDLS